MHQSSDIQLGYTESMKLALAQLRLLLAVILVIAGGAIAGLIEQASAIGVGGGTTDVATFSTSATHEATGHVPSTDQDNHRASCDGCLDCMHSTGFGCCAAGISASECGVLDNAPVAIRFVVGKALLATGIDPQALLQPPQALA